MSDPEVTIAVPVHDGAQTIEETLDSVFSQTFQDFELIVLDDGSRDESLDIVYGYSDARLRMERFEHRGIGTSFNRCIERARGRYLKVLPQDDLIHPECLRESVAALHKSRNPALFFSRRRIISDPSDRWSRAWLKSYENVDTPLQPLESVNDGKEVLARWGKARNISRNYIGEPVAVMFSVELARSLGGFSQVMCQNFDCLLWMRLMARGDVCFTNRQLCAFRLHASGTSYKNVLSGRVAFESLLMLEGLAADAEMTRLLPMIPELLRRQHRKVFGSPWKRSLLFWKHYPSVQEHPARQALERPCSTPRRVLESAEIGASAGDTPPLGSPSGSRPDRVQES
jgi:glycosyltransferase involved in cell wall biosynthesis